MSSASRTRPGWTLAIVSIALFMTTLDNLVVGVALPSIRADLGGSIESLEWTVNALHAGVRRAAARPAPRSATASAAGGCSSSASGVFTAASAAAALAPSIDALIAARAVQGLGAAIVAAAHADAAQPRRSPPAAPRRSRSASGPASAASASRSGPLVGGAVVEGISWHWIFWLNVPIGLALIPLARALPDRVLRPGPAPRPPRPRARRRRPARRRRSGSSAASALGLDERDRAGARSARASCCSSAFLAWERRAPAADAAAALLPLARLQRHQRRLVRDVLRRLRLDLPALASSSRPRRALAAGGRAADAAVDGRCRCSSRRSPACSATGSARGR